MTSAPAARPSTAASPHSGGVFDSEGDAKRLADIEKDLAKPDDQMKNRAKPLYEAFSDAELETEICRLLRPKDLKAELQVVFQSNASLRECCPNHTGDWYFTGDYPTPGGNRVVNRALVNYVENINTRAY